MSTYDQTPESHARAKLLSEILHSTIERFVHAQGATPPEVVNAALHVFTNMLCAMCRQDGASDAAIYAFAERLARQIPEDVRHKLATLEAQGTEGVS